MSEEHIVEVIEPQYIKVNANSEEQSIQIIKNSIQDPRMRDYINLKNQVQVRTNNVK